MKTVDVASAEPVVILDDDAPPGGRSDVWPLRPSHALRPVDLTDVRQAAPAVAVLADRLASLADAAWALDRGRVGVPGLVRELDRTAAKTMQRLARLVGGELAESLTARAEAVTAGDWAENTRRTVACADDRVVVVYGPLKTWSSKDEACRFSAIVSVENAEAQAIVDLCDEVLTEMVTSVGRECQVPDLGFWHVPGFVATDVLACGGEANTFPKHFALFLPEDAGLVDPSSVTKTVVYANVYEERFMRVSRALGATYLEPWHAVPRTSVRSALLAWFRGHDAVHFVGPDGERVDHLTECSSHERGTLHEVFADVGGYLIASSPEVLEPLPLRPADLAVVFLSELLRYYRRGWEWFPDSSAARLELTYLVEGGYVRVEAGDDGHRLGWDEVSLREGLVSLGRELSAGLVRGDAAAKERLRRLVGQPQPRWLTDLEQDIARRTAHLGDSLVFTYRS